MRRALTIAAVLAATCASADPGRPTGRLLPPGTVELSAGTSQTAPGASGGQTGRQVYTLGARYRPAGPWQWGATIEIFDDRPARPVGGRADDITHIGLGADVSYQWIDRPHLSGAVQLAGQWVQISRGATLLHRGDAPDSSRGLAVSLSGALTYDLTPATQISARLGYTHLPARAANGPGFGGRASAAVGVAHRWTDRALTYGSVKRLARVTDDAFDQGTPWLYTAGARLDLTRQSALTLYVTNAYGGTPVGGDLLFYADTRAPTFGAAVSYRPSGQGSAAKRFRPRTRAAEDRVPFGLSVPAAQVVPTDRLTARLGTNGLALRYSPDPLIDIGLAVEPIRTGAGFRNEGSPRYSITGRWQAMDRAAGAPVDLSFHLSAGRDIATPTLGVMDLGLSARARIGRAALTVAPRVGMYAAERPMGLGLGLSYDLTPTVTALAETTVLRGDAPNWTLGARYQPPGRPLSVELYATTAAALTGIGSLHSTDRATVGVAVSWDTAWGWL